MKKTLFLLSGLLLGASAFGSTDLEQLTLSISTQGPDYYADGQPLQVGETYLLVYLYQGHTFAGLYTDRTLVDPDNNKIATEGVAITGSKCDFKPIQYPASLYPPEGSWVIVALDTRTANGAVGGLVAGLGASAASATGETSLNALDLASQGTSEQAKMLSNMPAPEITAVEPGNVVDDQRQVGIRFTNVKDGALYSVESTTDLSSGDLTAAVPPVSAKAGNYVMGAGGTAELPATVGVSGSDKVRFFRVKPYGAAN